MSLYPAADLLGHFLRTVWLIVLIIPSLCNAGVQHSIQDENGLQRWHFSDGDIEIELVQRLPDQTRAMLMKHAFSAEVIEQMAVSCMFQTIIRNSGTSSTDSRVSIDLSDWRMTFSGKQRGIVMKEPLLASWSDEQADAAARLVVRWGMFPSQQTYLPGDYNWGLTAYGVPPGSRFDLFVVWREQGALRQGEIKGIVCAPDVDTLK